MKVMLIKRVLNKRLGYKVIEDIYNHYKLVDSDGVLIRYFLTREELFQFVKMIKMLRII